MAVEHTHVFMINGVRFASRDVVAGDLDANGVLTLVYNATARPWLILEAGLMLRGLAFEQGDPATDITAQLDGQMVMLTGLGAGATVVHQDAGVAAAHRFDVFPGNDVVLGRNPVQVFYSGAAERWWAPDWGAYLGSAVNFATPPTSTNDAIARLAAAVVGITGVPIP